MKAIHCRLTLFLLINKNANDTYTIFHCTTTATQKDRSSSSSTSRSNLHVGTPDSWRPVTVCSLTFICGTNTHIHTHRYTVHAHAYLQTLSKPNDTLIKMIIDWFIAFQSFDRNVCYVMHCLYTAFMLEPFCSPPTNVLFSWMYFQTLRNIYRSHRENSSSQVSAKQS